LTPRPDGISAHHKRHHLDLLDRKKLVVILGRASGSLIAITAELTDLGIETAALLRRGPAPKSAETPEAAVVNAQREWNIAWSRFEALQTHPPSTWYEDDVRQFNDIVTALEAFGHDLTSFRISNDMLKFRPTSIQHAGRSGRYPGSVRMAARRSGDEQEVRRQMEGIALYFQNLSKTTLPQVNFRYEAPAPPTLVPGSELRPALYRTPLSNASDQTQAQPVSAPPASGDDRVPDESESSVIHRVGNPVAPTEQSEGSGASAEPEQRPELDSQAEMEGENVDPQKRLIISDLMRGLGKNWEPPSLSPADVRVFETIQAISAKGYDRILRIAGRMETREEFISRLPELFRELGGEIPPGVLQPPRGKAGRPISAATKKIHAEWVRIERPEVKGAVCDRIAQALFPDEVKDVTRGSEQFRKVRERVRQAILRCERRAAT
jgi:hypothetical protein